MRIVISDQKRFLSSLGSLVAVIVIIGFFMQFFRVSAIFVSGNEKFTQEEIKILSGISEGQHMWGVNTEKSIENLETNPYLIPSVIKRYPSTIEIYVVEREPSAATALMNTWLLLDNDGRVLESQQNEAAIDGLIRVTGVKIAADTVKPGDLLETTDPLQLKSLSIVLSEIYLQEVSEIVYELNVADLDNMYLVSHDGLTVRLGDRERLGEKLQFMLSGMAGIAQGQHAAGVLDVSISKASFVPHPDSETAAPSEQPTNDKYPYDSDILVDWDNWN